MSEYEQSPNRETRHGPGTLTRNLRIFYRSYRETLWAMRAGRLAHAAATPCKLPYDCSSPVVYVKDWPRNCYTDDYAMALASRGSIKLAGIMTSSSVAPYNRWVDADDYERFVLERSESVQRARASGLRHIPDPVRGPEGHLRRPRSGRIEDTVPLDTEGTRLILDLAQRATPKEPLLIVVCAGLTVAADAYLMHPGAADRIVVAWLGGHERDMADYDGWSDGWAAYIVLERMRLVQFPPFRCDPVVPRSRLKTLPDTPLRSWMLDKELPRDQGAARDADAPPLVSIVRPDYVLETTRVSFGGWMRKEGHLLPALKDDPHGTALVVTCGDRRVASQAWWDAMTDPGTYSLA
jgi:hypothetical protein